MRLSDLIHLKSQNKYVRLNESESFCSKDGIKLALFAPDSRTIITLTICLKQPYDSDSYKVVWQLVLPQRILFEENHITLDGNSQNVCLAYWFLVIW